MMYSGGLYAVQNTPTCRFFRALKAQRLCPVTNMETESNINKGTDVQSQTFINKARHQPKIQNVSPVEDFASWILAGLLFIAKFS